MAIAWKVTTSFVPGKSQTLAFPECLLGFLPEFLPSVSLHHAGVGVDSTLSLVSKICSSFCPSVMKGCPGGTTKPPIVPSRLLTELMYHQRCRVVGTVMMGYSARRPPPRDPRFSYSAVFASWSKSPQSPSTSFIASWHRSPKMRAFWCRDERALNYCLGAGALCDGKGFGRPRGHRGLLNRI
jgi:hypothetical protein